MKRNYKLILSFLMILLTVFFVEACRKKNLPAEFELISSRFGEFKMYDQMLDGKIVKRIIHKEDDVYQSENLQLVQLNQIIQLNTSDMFLFTVESLDDNTQCPAKFLVITLNSEGKFKTFPEIGNCNDLPEVDDNGEQVTFTFNSILSYEAVTYRFENGDLKQIENQKSAARIINK
ncbi:MAG TPA: hypothetical protein PK079_23775 [Leptospiraceae bacterium]|nr:hypothetical protein [Leptospiraceae bacterium]HMW05387.1 hypothetical protein [Leptospiraceae bacterium]HMX32831.1 hypothetical protein [Leptospiraceae bacterium]HMY33871.1 hypothetical protein [Leptospiraceae bacterium]HMZ64489.1 hypothetical protein [Leptospiraceae bacterium]